MKTTSTWYWALLKRSNWCDSKTVSIFSTTDDSEKQVKKSDDFSSSKVFIFLFLFLSIDENVNFELDV